MSVFEDDRSIKVLTDCLESMEVPEDLRKILERYVELYGVANKCYHALKDAGFTELGDAGFDLRFDVTKDTMLMGITSYKDVIEGWEALKISGYSAIILKASYSRPCGDDDAASKLKAMLKPLEDVGFCISVIPDRIYGQFKLLGLITHEAMMSGEKGSEDELFFEMAPPLALVPTREGPTALPSAKILHVALNALSREKYALEVMEGYGVTREGLGLPKDPAICTTLEAIIEAAKVQNLDAVKALMEEIDIPQVKKQLERAMNP